MFCFIKRYLMSVFIISTFLAICPTLALAEENVINENKDLVWGFERRIWEQAVDNIEQLELEEENQRIAALTLEERYNEYYRKYLQKLIKLYKEVDYLKDVVKQYQEDLENDAYNLREEINLLEREVANLQTASHYYYSKDYLVKSCQHLSKAANALDLYCLFYLHINDNVQAQGYWDSLCAEMVSFEENFKKANNYYLLTKKGKIVTDNYNESEAQFNQETQKYYEVFSQVYRELNKAYEMIERGENSSPILRELQNQGRIGVYNFMTLRTLKYRDVIGQLQEISALQVEVFKELDRYIIDKLTGFPSNKDKVTAKLNVLKTKLDELQENLLRIEKETERISGNVDERTQQINEDELNEAQKHGYSSVEEYLDYLARQKQKERNKRFIQEAERLTEEKQRIQAEYEAMLKAMEEEWLDMRIDFSKSRAFQKHDKAYYMQKVRESLSDVFAWSSQLGSVIYQKQAAAYDRMWQLAQTNGANLRLLQELYDQYPNDFITIVLVYSIESSVSPQPTPKSDLNVQPTKEF